MIQLRKGIVKKIIKSTEDYIEMMVEIQGVIEKAIQYPHLTGPVQIGDSVFLNTTAEHFKLGTGGYHFVIANESIEKLDTDVHGHIMKMKYTPVQLNCDSVEEHHTKIFNEFSSLKKMPVLVGSIHSMLPPAVAMIKSVDPKIRIAYIMTDGGSLPIAFSNIVRNLKEKRLIDTTITTGNAFGGDYEAVNLYTALITAREIARCDIALVIMGPGHIGTNTALGFTGMEVSQNLQIVQNMGGIPIAIPRVSFGDKRKRHYGISHHFLTALGSYCTISVHIVFPIFEKGDKEYIMKQYLQKEFDKKHGIHFVRENTIEQLENLQLSVTTMGRNIQEDPYFFRTAGACGKYGAEILKSNI